MKNLNWKKILFSFDDAILKAITAAVHTEEIRFANEHPGVIFSRIRLGEKIVAEIKKRDTNHQILREDSGVKLCFGLILKVDKKNPNICLLS
jgi:hypothetical protein